MLYENTELINQEIKETEDYIEQLENIMKYEINDDIIYESKEQLKIEKNKLQKLNKKIIMSN